MGRSVGGLNRSAFWQSVQFDSDAAYGVGREG